jgi:hypothetical protein
VTEWARRALAGAGLSLDVLADAEVSVEEEPGRGWLAQFAPPLELAVWYGPGQTLERWSTGVLETWPEASIGVEEAATACDVPARRQRAELPERPAATGGFPTAHGGIELRTQRFPARVTVALALKHQGIPVLATWTVDADREEELRSAERHFFQALECRPAWDRG